MRASFLEQAPLVESLRGLGKSARLALAAPLWISAVLVGLALDVNLETVVWVSIAITLLMHTSFVLNDIVDRRIDELNGKQKWRPRNTHDWLLVAILASALLVAILLAVASAGFDPSLVLLATVGVAAVYGNLKKVTLVGNLAAAFMVSSAGIIFLVSAVTAATLPNLFELTGALVLAGFLYIFAREVRLDMNDRVGDELGGRLTYPVIFSDTVCRVIIGCVLAYGLAAISSVAWRYGDHWRLVLAIAMAYVAAMIYAFKTDDFWVFVSRSRAAFALWPACFLAISIQ